MVIKVNLSDLQRKDIVDIKDGKRLGRIIDAEINEQGFITNFYVEKRRFFHFFNFKDDITINIKQIQKIGEDVILVIFENEI